MPLFKEIATEILSALEELPNGRAEILFGDAERFKAYLKEQNVEEEDPISSFAIYIHKNENNILESWNNRLKISPNDLKFKEKRIKEIHVLYQEELVKKYLGKFVSCSDKPGYINILKDSAISIIDKGKSFVLLNSDDVKVGAVIRNASNLNILKHFGSKMKLTVDVHYPIKRGEAHKSNGTMVGHGYRKNFLNKDVGTYAYEDKNISPESLKIIDNDGNTLGRWLYDHSSYYLPWATESYEKFKENVKLENDDIIGAVFCTKNYEAVGHRDKDRSDWAVGYVYEEGIVKEGYFFYPEYGVAIEMESNTLWCWLSKAVHGTAILDLSEGGDRYTAVLTLTEKTAKAVEKKKGLLK